MAFYRFRAALNAASFPLSTILAGRTVLEPKLDSNIRTPQSFYGTSESAELNTPQLLYCENVMPTAEGIQSVAFEEVIGPKVGSVDFDQAITLRDENENNFLFVPAGGKNYIWNTESQDWDSVNPITDWFGGLVTRAYVNGRTFICYESYGIFEYDATTGAFNKQVLKGISDSEVRGIGNSNNYLLAFTTLEVHWSSLIDPLDFEPSYTTGAGYAIPQDVKAQITAVLGVAGGFIVYTLRNAIAGVYTNNAKAPFNFKEIANCGGVLSYEQVSSEQTSGAQFAWTTAGLQKITLQTAEPVAAEVNDFIAGRMWDEFDPETKELLQFYTTLNEFPTKTSFISSRFLVLSYQTTADSVGYNWALVYDVTLKRWGKLKIDHTDCFSYPFPNVLTPISYDNFGDQTYNDLENISYNNLGTGSVTGYSSKLTVAFLQQGGTVKLLRMDYYKSLDGPAIAIFGKFQLLRQRMLQLQRLDLEGVYGSAALPEHEMTVSVGISTTGFEVNKVLPMVKMKEQGKFVSYAKRATGKNFNVIVEGVFALSSYLLEVTQDGDR